MSDRTHWGRLLDDDRITAPVEPKEKATPDW